MLGEVKPADRGAPVIEGGDGALAAPPRAAGQSRDMRVGVFLPEGYPLLTLSLVIESLRIANGFEEGATFSTVLISEKGLKVQSSCAFPAPVTHSIHDHSPIDILLVCAGAQTVLYRSKAVFSWLRRHYHAGTPIGGISSGAFLLARAGLLEGRSCAVHWETQDIMRETFPGVNVTSDIFCIDGRIITCAGGIAALDLMLHLLSQARGRVFARRLADLMIYPVVRDRHEPARINPAARTDTGNPLVMRAIEIMERNIETPLKVGAISRRLGTTPRHLERLFERSLRVSPARYYMRLRLRAAEGLLSRTEHSVAEIALRCGFSNPSHFTRRFRESFKKSPRDHRGS